MFRMLGLAAVMLLALAGCGKSEKAATPPFPKALKAKPLVQVSAPKARFHSTHPEYTNWWFNWSMEVHAGSYDTAGRKNPKWDAPVREALTNFAYLRVFGRLPGATSQRQYRDHLKIAIEAGCDDPVVVYLHARNWVGSPESATVATATKYIECAKAIESSGYPSYLKFFLSLRAAEAVNAAYTNRWAEVCGYRDAAREHLKHILETSEIPAGAAYDASKSLFDVIDQNRAQRLAFHSEIEPLLLARWSDEGFPHLLRGRFYISYAWEARTAKFADQVTEEGWEKFAERLGQAEDALHLAWELDPRLPETPLEYMRVELGQGRGREVMEKWFQRAVAFPQNRYQAVANKLFYLQPRWYGDEETCLTEARAILKSDLFTGQTPLQLYHTHESLATYFKDLRPNYWTEPQVWPDIKASFDRYYSGRNADLSWKHNYVLCAWRCRQWKTFLAEAEKLSSVNYPYFGGKAKWESMIEEAQQRVR